MKKLYLLILPLILLPLVVKASDSFPSFPMAFYGVAKYSDGEVLPVGSKVSANCNNVSIGQAIVQSDGVYGYDNPTKSKLVVNEYSGCTDLVFKFGNIESTIKHNSVFVSGSSIKLDLSFVKSTPPITQTPSPGGGGGAPTPATPVVGDINNDGKVNKYDFSLMMANWGKTGTNASDLNKDGKVDKYDFALLMAKWTGN